MQLTADDGERLVVRTGHVHTCDGTVAHAGRSRAGRADVKVGIGDAQRLVDVGKREADLGLRVARVLVEGAAAGGRVDRVDARAGDGSVLVPTVQLLCIASIDNKRTIA